MNLSRLQFHHFGLAVRRPDEARTFVTSLGYRLGDYVFDPAQNVHLQMCHHADHPDVEIIWPGDTPGPVDRLVQRRPAGIVYHLCYVTDDLAATLAGCEAAGCSQFAFRPPPRHRCFREERCHFTM